MVDKIPSNSITNKIGNAKLSEEEKTALKGIENLESYGTDTDFAENIYKALGTELNLPTAAEITEEFFTVDTYVAGNLSIAVAPDYTPYSVYRHQKDTDSYGYIKEMFVNKYWGGRRFFKNEEDMENRADEAIKEFKTRQLEAGDIIVSVKAKDKENLNYDFENINVFVYDGSRLLCSRKTPEGVTHEIISEENVLTELTKLFMTDKDLFFALRPSQAK